MSLLRGPDQRALFFRQLSTMVGAGMSLVGALQVLAERGLKYRMQQFAVEAVRVTSAGKPFSSVATRYPDLFSPLVAAMLNAGERSGRLDEMLQRIADYMERDQELQRLISRETFYPKILLFAIIFIPLAAQLVIAGFFGGVDKALLLLLRTLAIYVAVVGIPLLLIVVAYRSLRGTQKGAETIDTIKVHIPVFGNIVRKLALSKFARALSAGYGSGIPFSEAVTLAGESVGNRALSAVILRCVPDVDRGIPLSESLARNQLVDLMVVRMLQTGEQTGNIDGMMDKVADHFEDESETAIRKGTMLIVPISVLIFGGIVLYMTAKFYLNLYGGLLGAG